MTDITSYIWLLVALLTVIYYWKVVRGKGNRHQGKLLSGPPVIEGLRRFAQGSVQNTLHLYMMECAQKYGDIFRVNLLMKDIVIVNDAQTFRRLVGIPELRDLTNDRPLGFYRDYVNRGDIDIDFAPSGPVLQKRRRLFHSLLKFFGEGKEKFEQLMLTSLDDLAKSISAKETVEISVEIRNYILLLLTFLLTGDITDSAQKDLYKLRDFSKAVNDIFALPTETMLSCLPILRVIPGLHFKHTYDRVRSATHTMHSSYFYAMKETFDTDHRSGMIDEMLALLEDTDKDTSGTHQQINNEIVKGITHDVVAGGYLTTSSTLNTLFLLLIHQPDLQARLHKEIQNVLGDTAPGFRHRHDMPITEAAILETLRLSSTAPLLLPHMARENVHFDGYFFPKSTVLIMNAWYNHHRPDFWEHPYVFKPDRFLDANGQLLAPDHPIRQRLIPFGSGRRACPGETFGKSRVFLITTFLLQRFEFLPPDDDDTLPSLDPRKWPCGAAISPQNFKCKIKPRKQ